MKKVFSVVAQIAVFVALFAVLAGLITGCASVTEATKGKSVNLEFTLYGLKFESNDPTAANTPTGKLGFGSVRYRSIPMEAGQPFYVKEEVGSIWGTATKTTIWIGRASEKSVLEFEAVPDTMISVCKDGVKSGSSTVTITP